MTLLTLLTIFSVTCANTLSFQTNAYSDVTMHADVLNVPFVALVKIPKKLHLVSDQFVLTQTIDIKTIVEHLNDLKNGYIKVKNKFLEANVTFSNSNQNEELKMFSMLDQVAQTITSGFKLLPQKNSCDLRSKRSLRTRKKRYVDLDSESKAVDTTALFPALGNVFSWFTGTLNQQAGEVINSNVRNIKKLTKMSLKFADMINATLTISKKHYIQIAKLNKKVDELEVKLDSDLDKINSRISFSEFLQNMIFIAMDLQRTVDNVFQLTDKAEFNRMGAFARDPIFLETIQEMMDYKLKQKQNSLYLMKISSKIDVEACHWVIFVSYKFPVFDVIDFVPRRVLSIPKEIKGKFFELENIPYVITWGEKVYSFTEKEFRNCDHHNNNIFCRVPGSIKPLLESCLYGLAHKMPWRRLSIKCQLLYTESPEEFVEFTESSMVFFFREPRYATVICESYSKPLTLEGSGIIEIPTGCRVKYGDQETFSLGHIARTKNVILSLDDRIWKTNFSHMLPTLSVTNVKNVSSLWVDTSKEEKIIEKGLKDVHEIIEQIKFTPTGITITLWTLIGYAIVVTGCLIAMVYCICAPRSVISCKKCCGCKKQPKSVYIKDL